MPTFTAYPLGTGVAIVHDMADQVVVSELDGDQADVLADAIRSARLAGLRGDGGRLE